jgi:hypothetical protein
MVGLGTLCVPDHYIRSLIPHSPTLISRGHKCPPTLSFPPQMTRQNEWSYNNR